MTIDFRPLLTAAALCGLFMVPVGTPVQAQTSPQLLQNRSCESTKSGNDDPKAWTELNNLDWTCDDQDVTPVDGSLYFYLQDFNVSQGEVKGLQQEVTIEGGTTYRFFGRLRSKGGDKVGFEVRYLDKDGVQTGKFTTGGFFSDVSDTGGDWETKAHIEELPEGTASVQVQLLFDSADNNVDGVFFDDLQLLKKVQTTEIMENPSAVADSDGEYIELYNSAASSIDLSNWTLNVGGTSKSISPGTVPARGTAVLCANTNADSNGGVRTCDDQVNLNLGDTSDRLVLRNSNGLTVDSVNYDSNWPVSSGPSMVFTSVTGTNTAGNWTTASRREQGFELNQSESDEGSPGRVGTDQSVQPTASVGGSAGWRMLAAPVGGVTPGTLADVSLVQGISGLPLSGFDPNVFQWPGGKEGNTSWQPPASSDDLTGSNAPSGAGSGYIWFVFDGGKTKFTDVPPFALSVPGVVRTTNVTTASLSGTSTTNSAFHLLGNPYGQSFDLSGLNLSAQNFQTTVQVWDPSDDSYDNVTQDNQSDSDLLSAYQGFFVERATSGSATLTFDAGKTSSTSEPLKRTGRGPARVGFRLTGRDAEGDTLTRDRALTLLLRPEASLAWDVHDASKLTPLSGRYVTAAFRGSRDGRSVRKAVSSVPPTLPDSTVELPVVLNARGAGAVETLTLSWPEWTEVPDEWQLTLRDAAADTTVDLRRQSSYTFTMANEKLGLSGEARTADRTLPPPRPPTPRRAKTASDTSRFTLTIQSGAIPVELNHLGATLSGRRATINWSTASETQNAGFSVQHRAPDADEFSALGFVEGHGTTQTPHSYRYRTEPLNPGTHTFRLRQVDTDGTEHRTRTVDVTVSLDEPYTATVRPHPVTTDGTIELTVRRRQQVRIAVYDILGRRVATLFDEPLPADEPTQIPLRPGSLGLTSGTYFLKIDGDTFSGTERLGIVR